MRWNALSAATGGRRGVGHLSERAALRPLGVGDCHHVCGGQHHPDQHPREPPESRGVQRQARLRGGVTERSC